MQPNSEHVARRMMHDDVPRGSDQQGEAVPLAVTNDDEVHFPLCSEANDLALDATGHDMRAGLGNPELTCKLSFDVKE